MYREGLSNRLQLVEVVVVAVGSGGLCMDATPTPIPMRQ
jgi:hypothetical protein